MSFLLLNVLLPCRRGTAMSREDLHAIHKRLIQATNVFGIVRLWGELSTHDSLDVVNCLSGFIYQSEYWSLKVKETLIFIFNHWIRTAIRRFKMLKDRPVLTFPRWALRLRRYHDNVLRLAHQKAGNTTFIKVFCKNLFNARKLEGTAVALSHGPLMKFDIQRVRQFCLRAHGRAAAAVAGLRGGLLTAEWCRTYPGKW